MTTSGRPVGVTVVQSKRLAATGATGPRSDANEINSMQSENTPARAAGGLRSQRSQVRLLHRALGKGARGLEKSATPRPPASPSKAGLGVYWAPTRKARTPLLPVAVDGGYTPAQAAACLGISIPAVYRLIRGPGGLVARRYHGHRRLHILPADLAAYQRGR